MVSLGDGWQVSSRSTDYMDSWHTSEFHLLSLDRGQTLTRLTRERSIEDEPPAWGQKHVCIDHQTMADNLVAHTDDHGWNKTSNQQQRMLIQNLNRIVSRPNVTPGHMLYRTTNCIPIDFMVKENFPTYTHVWNSLDHRNDYRQIGVIWVTYAIGSLKKWLMHLWTSILPEPGQPSAQLSKLISLTACIQRWWYKTVHISWLVASYDSH